VSQVTRQHGHLYVNPSNFAVAIKHRLLRLRIHPDAVWRGVSQSVRRVNHHVGDLARDMPEVMRRDRGIGLAASRARVRARLITADVGQGPPGRVVLHEIDHLDGVLICVCAQSGADGSAATGKVL